MKISHLTKEQTDRFQEFIDKWTAIGLCTEPANRKEAEVGIAETYTSAGLAPPKRIVWCGSPLSQGLTRAIALNIKPSEVEKIGQSVWQSVRQRVGKSVERSVRHSVWQSVWQSVEQSVRQIVEQSVGQSVGQSVRHSVEQSVGQSVGQSVWQSVEQSVEQSVRQIVEQSVRQIVEQSVWQSVGQNVWQIVERSVWQSVWQSAYGQHDANWLGFYDYFRQVCGLEAETQKLCGLWRVAQNAGWWLPHESICWISERHNVLNRNALGQLHKDGGPALAYPDGWCIYALNGVRMSREYVETPAERIDPSTVFDEKNAEIRRELIRKLGVERFLAKTPHTVLETKGSYQLLSVELSEQVTDARYLKMLNPSVGAWHVEAVHPSCSTVREAINWRASQKTDQEWSPALLT